MRKYISSLPLATILTLILGLGMTAALSWGIHQLEVEKAELDFDKHAHVRVSAITQGFSNAIRALHTVNQLFTAMDAVSREQFETFTQPLLTRTPYIQALVFHRLIRADERASFEADMRRSFPDFDVIERAPTGLARAGERDFYLVDDYIVPMAGNEMTLGYDAWTETPQRQATQNAIDTGLPTATAIKNLLQDHGTARGIVVVMPVYRHGARLTNVESRRRAFIGDTEVVLKVETLIEGALRQAQLLDSTDGTLAVYASSAANPAKLAYFFGGNAQTREKNAVLEGWLSARTPHHTHSFDVAGQPWYIDISAPRVALTNYLGSLLTLILGALLSFLASAYVHASTSRSKRIAQLVTERTADLKRASDALRLHQRAIAASANPIIIANANAPDYSIEYVNPAFERTFGYAENEVIGKNLMLLAAKEADQPGIEALHTGMQEQREYNTILRQYCKDGSVVLSDIYIASVQNEMAQTEHFVATLYDITATKAYEAELAFQAHYDTLTGLANRSLLQDRLRQAMRMARVNADEIWCVMLDLNRFKFINDTLGYQAGNGLLKSIAERLKLAVPLTDTVARLGGDEFVLLLANRSSAPKAMGAVLAVMDTVAQALTVDAHQLFLTCSLGIAVFPTDGSDADTLLKHAEIAMYRAKESGRNNFQFYAASMNERALERLKLENALRGALEREEFELHYQPQVDLKTGRIVGMEALIRWHHPELGLLQPSRFIGLAEETGLIIAIGTWVLRTACRQNKDWQRAGLGQLHIAVNLSARQFSQPDLAKMIAAVLGDTELAPEFLEIELTESLVITNVDQAIEVMHELKALGIKLSIDDFGTGYSNLSYLKHFPIDVLKIDQSFVRDISVDKNDAAVVLAVISLAHSLGLQVIAEGVETPVQLDFLHQHDCDEIQGYLFSRPVPAAKFEQILREGKCLTFLPSALPIL